MKKFITINGKEYRPAEITFNSVCQMEEMGASLTDAKNRSMSLLRAYLAISMNQPEEIAGRELEAHVINGGDVEELAEALAKAIEDSGFFQALSKTTEAKAGQVESKPSKK